MIIRCIASGSSGNCHILEENGQLVILDAGIRMADIKKGIGFRIADIITVFIGHGHKDHCKSERQFINMGADVFAPYHSENLMQVHKNKGWYFKSFSLPHGDCPNAGTYIMSPEGHKIIYATDFQYCPYVFTKLGINTFLIECNHDDEFDKEENEGHWEHSVRDHSSISTVCEFLRVNKTDEMRTVILCHTSENNLNVDDAVCRVREVVGDMVQVYVARKGMEIQI